MSRQNSYRLSVIYQAILATTLGATAFSAHAVNLSQADIQSAQHEPLSATINVSDIDAKNFNAKLASGAIYQQMGLSQNANIQVQFTATSETTGRIRLSSSTPISTPFTDVVLSLDNNGEQVVKPQTLLMPVSQNSNAIAPDLTTPILVAAEEEQNLPVVSNLPIDNSNAVISGEPLQVQNTAPPPLFPEVSDSEVVDDSAITASNTAAEATDSQSTAAVVQDTAVVQDAVAPKVLSQEQRVIASITPDGSNKQLEILTEQITQRIYPAGTAPKTPLIFDKQDEQQDEQMVAQDSQDSALPADNEQAQTDIDTQSSTGAVYVVQSGDNLWSIANEIAKANKMDVADVMKALFSQNPEAFSNGKAEQLKANVSLSIPNYDVVPSQKAISEAIAASHKSKAKKQQAVTAKSKKPKTRGTPASNTKAQTRKSTARPLPKPQVTLVTPNQNGQATGSQTRASAPSSTTTNGNQDLVASLKNTRSKTAGNAQRVNSLNQELSSATQKLQLQNKKLAELEARLKALKDKK